MMQWRKEKKMINEFEYNELKKNYGLVILELQFIEHTYKDNIPFPIDMRVGSLVNELIYISRRLKELERIKLLEEE